MSKSKFRCWPKRDPTENTTVTNKDGQKRKNLPLRE